MNDYVDLHGDAVIGRTAGVTGLALNELHTYRFESLDVGQNYWFGVDGLVFLVGDDNIPRDGHKILISSTGGCSGDSFVDKRQEWDYIRYGTITRGEQIIAADPPAGEVLMPPYPGFDRFTVTFDAPNYVVLDEITVESTAVPAPVVTQTLRPDDSDPAKVEIILDRPLADGETARFTFDDGVATGDVEYTVTILPTGACCDEATGTCTDGVIQTECESTNRRYGGDGSDCLTIDPPCLPPPPTGACCNDANGVCSEGVTDTDCGSTGRRFGGDGSDCGTIAPPCVPPTPTGACCHDIRGECIEGVTQPDCESTGRRYGGDGSDCSMFDPPCLRPEIPAASTWGLAVLTLLLLVTGKIVFGRSSGPPIRTTRDNEWSP